MKVRNVIRAGAVVAASAALVSVGGGMELTGYHSSAVGTKASMKTIITSSLGYTSATYVGSPGEVSPQIVGIKPMDASGCTGAPPGLSGEFGFFISVSGSGTYVNWIRTSAYACNDGCGVAQLLRNGNVIMQMPQVCYGNPTQYCVGSGCGAAGTMLSAQFDFYSSSWFHDGDVVCARYEGTNGTFPFSGKQFSPEVCETIE